MSGKRVSFEAGVPLDDGLLGQSALDGSDGRVMDFASTRKSSRHVNDVVVGFSEPSFAVTRRVSHLLRGDGTSVLFE